MPSQKKLIGVVFGGASGEHNVSIKSAATVIKALNSKVNSARFKVTAIYIDIKGGWWGEDFAQKALTKGSSLDESDFPVLNELRMFSRLPLETEKVDIWYPVLHGPNGEDGTVQGLFELTGKPYVGSGVMASAIGMDKLAMKAVFNAAGLPQVPYLSANALDLTNTEAQQKLIHKIQTKIGYPCFIKPANLGSSVGITKANNPKDLLYGLNKAAKMDRRIVIEEGVLARELECAVLGSDELKISPVGEIRFKSDWYDYDTKYSQGGSEMLIPAPLDKTTTQNVQNLTLQACKAISINGMARVDFFYKERTNELWINEINTLPGFTASSMYPSLWEAGGIPLDQLVAKLIETAQD